MKAKDGTLYAVLGLLVTLGVTHMARQADTDANIDGINSIIDQAQELSEISHEKLDSGDYSRTEAELEIDESLPGSGVEMQRYLANIIESNNALANEYIAELQSIGWFAILDAERLQRDPGLTESRIIIDQARSLVTTFGDRSVALIDDARSSIERLEIAEAEKSAMRAGFDANRASGVRRTEQLWDYEMQSVDEVVKIVDLLNRETGRWEVVGNQIVFDASDSADAFNRHLANVDELVRKQTTLQQDAFNSARSMLQ